jgi:hypothetical protein
VRAVESPTAPDNWEKRVPSTARCPKIKPTTLIITSSNGPKEKAATYAKAALSCPALSLLKLLNNCFTNFMGSIYFFAFFSAFRALLNTAELAIADNSPPFSAT